jgi:hypothetical protein
LECGGKRSATPLWMSDKLQFVVDFVFISTCVVINDIDKLKVCRT